MYLLQGAREFDKGSAYSLADFLMLLNRDNVLIDTSSTDDTEMQALELASSLLPYYKDLDAKDADGYTMLSYTARSGNTEMTDLLLKMGAEEIIPNYKAISEVGGDEMDEEDSDSEGREELETAWDATRLIIDEWVGPWTAENYGKYMNSLERYGRVVITRSRDGSESDEIFWDIITN
ncbi:unnamed protein product [Clonostachys byssicola]|uniref:Uncharacterized protein n=1 Tax=Clonostachys byssicola TaxID=160290 RepID=A0A9N9Y5T3_9HYPO|nr:unnamed protein product [Clonostachys byssicola]